VSRHFPGLVVLIFLDLGGGSRGGFSGGLYSFGGVRSGGFDWDYSDDLVVLFRGSLGGGFRGGICAKDFLWSLPILLPVGSLSSVG
jgi:hypothetical protein